MPSEGEGEGEGEGARTAGSRRGSGTARLGFTHGGIAGFQAHEQAGESGLAGGPQATRYRRIAKADWK